MADNTYEGLKKRCEGQRRKIAQLEKLLTERRVALVEIIGPDEQECTLPGLLRAAASYSLTENFAERLLRRADLAQVVLDGIAADKKRSKVAA